MFRNALKKRRWKLFLLSVKGWKLEKEGLALHKNLKLQKSVLRIDS